MWKKKKKRKINNIIFFAQELRYFLLTSSSFQKRDPGILFVSPIPRSGSRVSRNLYTWFERNVVSLEESWYLNVGNSPSQSFKETWEHFFFFAGRRLEKRHSFTKGYETKLCAATGFKNFFFACDGLKKNLGFKTYEYQTGWSTAADIRASKSFFQLQSARKKKNVFQNRISNKVVYRENKHFLCFRTILKRICWKRFSKENKTVFKKKKKNQRVSEDLKKKQILLLNRMVSKNTIDNKHFLCFRTILKRLCWKRFSKENKTVFKKKQKRISSLTNKQILLSKKKDFKKNRQEVWKPYDFRSWLCKKTLSNFWTKTK